MNDFLKHNSFLFIICAIGLVVSFALTSCGDDDEWDYDEPTYNNLTAPKGCTGKVVSNGVLLSWDAVTEADYYRVSRSTSLNGETVSLGYIGDSGRIYDTSVIDTNPREGDNYYYIYAIGYSGSKSNPSKPIYVYYSQNGGGGNGDEYPDYPGGGNDNSGGWNDNPGGGNDNPGGGGGSVTQKPEAPTGVTVSNEGSAMVPDVRIRCNTVNNATSYYIYKSSSANGSYSKIGETTFPQYGFADPNPPTNGKTAYYKVKAVNSAGESPYSNYAVYTAPTNDEAFSPAYVYGNCSVSGNNITLRWTNSTGNGYGKATEIVLRVWNPFAEEWQDTQLSPSATSATFNFSTKIDASGFVKAGIVVSNANGSFNAGAKIYDTKNKKWLN